MDFLWDKITEWLKEMLIGVPLFFLLKGSIGTSPAAMVMMVVMIPAMLFAMYETVSYTHL